MPKFNPDNLNIHELSIEEPEKERETFFDSEKDISQEDWDKMLENRLKSHRKAGSWENFAETVAQMKILEPEYNLTLDEKEWDGIKKRFNDFSNLDNAWLLSKLAMNVKIAFPDRNLDFTKKDLKMLNDELNTHIKKRNWVGVMHLAAIRKILDPNFRLDIDEESWQEIEGAINMQKLSGDHVRNAMYLKILNPNHAINFGGKDWEKMKYQFEMSKNGDPWVFADWAVSLQVLSADEIHIPNGGGLELIRGRKPDLQTETPVMPEQKQF